MSDIIIAGSSQTKLPHIEIKIFLNKEKDLYLPKSLDPSASKLTDKYSLSHL